MQGFKLLERQSLVRVAVVSFALLGQLAWSQAPQTMVKPEDLGLLVPRNRAPVEVQDRTVLVHPDQLMSDAGRSKPDKNQETSKKRQEPVAAKVYVEVGNRYIIKLPDGTLRSLPKRETTSTDRPFEPIEKDDLASLLKEQFRGFKTRTTKRYICVYNTSDSFCKGNMTILETMYPMLKSYFKRQKFEVDDPDVPLVVVMFKNKSDFQKYRKMPDSLLAYYNGVNNRVFLYQYSDVALDAPNIAMQQAVSTIAHEGVHQILHNIGVQKRLSDWPIWASEGLAEYFSPTSTKGSKWRGVGKPNPLRMRELFKHFKEVRGLGSGNLVQHVVSADRLNSTEYAVAWALTHYLMENAKRRKTFLRYLRDSSDRGPLEKVGDELDIFKEYFGGDELASIEREMVRHVGSLPYVDPVLNQPYYLVAAVSGTRKYAVVTSSLDHAKTRKMLVSKLPPSERARVRFLPPQFYRNKQIAQQALKVFTGKR